MHIVSSVPGLRTIAYLQLDRRGLHPSTWNQYFNRSILSEIDCIRSIGSRVTIKEMSVFRCKKSTVFLPWKRIPCRKVDVLSSVRFPFAFVYLTVYKIPEKYVLILPRILPSSCILTKPVSYIFRCTFRSQKNGRKLNPPDTLSPQEARRTRTK